MKSFLLIGMGSFGHHLCRCLAEQGCEILAVDKSEGQIADLLELPISAKIGDCTNIDVLRSFDVPSFDACIVCTGSSFQDSLEITDLLHELGAKMIYSKADNDLHEKFLLRNGADHVIYPERDIARRLAISASSDSIFDCIGLSEKTLIFEMSAQPEWIGRTLREIDFRRKYNMTILATKRGDYIQPIATADYVFNDREHLLVLGSLSDMQDAIAE